MTLDGTVSEGSVAFVVYYLRNIVHFETGRVVLFVFGNARTAFVMTFQVQYNVALTEQKNADQVLNRILLVLPQKNVDFVQKG